MKTTKGGITMKKYMVVILVIVLGLGMLQGVQAEESEIYSMQLPSFKINIQGIEVDNLHNRNPILVYDGITYIPMIYEYHEALSFKSSWSKEKGLMINTSGSSGKLIQDRAVNNDRDKYYNAVKPSFDVYFNERRINNNSSKFPILVYNGITYFPLVEEYLKEGFNITLTWSREDGLTISNKTINENMQEIDLTKVNLNNAIIEMSVRDKLNKPQEELTKVDLQSIKILNLSNEKLENLEGIEYLTNIEELYLDNNSLEQINRLRTLTKLRILHLQRNRISDISPLEGLRDLTELSLNGNRIISLNPLSSLINLQKLYFTENNITDIKPIKNLANINSLYMNHGNKIRDYSPIVSYYENIVKKDFNFTREELENILVDSKEPLLNIAELIDEASLREKDELKLNGYYAISSSDQFEDFQKNKSITTFDSISFGWAFVDYDFEDEKAFINVKSTTSDFYIPKGYKDPIDYLKRNNIDTNINIYTSKNYNELFKSSDDMIDQILSLLRGKNSSYKGLNFDGVVIDFENLPIEHKENYVEFLLKLDEELTKYNKNLIVAVSPIGSYDFGKIVEISDNVILMLHDYDIKDNQGLSVINESVDNPNTPIEKIKGDLIDILNEIDRGKYISKLWIQINFAINQSNVSDGRIINQVPYTPKYDSLAQRIHSEVNSGKDIESVIGYNEIYQNPYVIYTEGQVTSSIWYEDDRSVSEKIKLARDLGFGGISLWRIGNIPDYSPEYYLNTWDMIRKFID